MLVASIDDLIRMKRAAGRAKDLIEVEVLAAVRDELERATARGRSLQVRAFDPPSVRVLSVRTLTVGRTRTRGSPRNDRRVQPETTDPMHPRPHATGSVNAILAPPPSRSSAQIRAAVPLDQALRDRETEPGALAAPVAGRGRRARSDRTSSARRPAGCPRPCPRPPPATVPFTRSAPTTIEPSGGVWRTAFASRFRSTRSIFSGATSTSGKPVGHPALERDPAGARLRRERLDRGLDQRSDRHAVGLERGVVRVDLRELEQVVDQHAERVHLLPHRGQVVLGLDDPVLDRLEHRLERGDGGPQVVARPRARAAAARRTAPRAATSSR